ncbi:hypothetical protein DV532_26510 (plasmid) [Pseudomonas sp. Leaf58]|uniref:hypothetical protein n=1 Tax=Pseudomonas sp. Leaf58 TaxID=1736226 RepID=UPI0006FBE142|nr:hypothetical protein [Pseudomonas sp. Leaf58]AYG47839.1 hypothetical protein DV532_26510 [Pseudomonas sp. Leaf58]KQN62595.1 hypothetical protein ASF02_10640 [Pseudomonas sp. Leaf58]
MANTLTGWRFTTDIYPRQAIQAGHELPDYLEAAARKGDLQRYCQNALRRYMLDGPANTMKTDGAAVDQVAPLSNLPPYTFQVALALSIPAPDFEQLFEFAEIMLENPDILDSWFRNIPSCVQFDAYNLYRLPTIDLDYLKRHFGLRQEQVLAHIVETDDVAMAMKIHEELHDPLNNRSPVYGQAKILKALAEIPFTESKIRKWITPNQPISLHEVHMRIKAQMRALEIEPSMTIVQTFEKRPPDYEVYKLPRYQEYLERQANEFGVSFWVGLGNVKMQTPQVSILPLVNRLLEDLLDTLGTGRHRFFLERHGIRISPWISDLEDEPDALMANYFEQAFHLYRNSKDMSKASETTMVPNYLSRAWVSAFILREPRDVIMKYCRNDQDLEVAYKVTGSIAFLDAMSDRGTERLLSEELGL